MWSNCTQLFEVGKCKVASAFHITLVEDSTLLNCNFWVWPSMSAGWLCCLARPRYGQRLLP